MADKTPPYIPEDYLPLEEETALRSQVVRTNSLFCQSLLREMSENSLILLPKATSDKDLAKSDYFSSESKENSTPDSLFKLIRRCSGMKTSVSGNMFNDQIEKISSNVPSDISSKETSNKTVPELPMERFCSTNRDVSAKEVEVLSSQVPSKESSLKRSRNLSSEGESEDSFEKRTRVSAEEIGTGEQEKEMSLISPVMSPMTQDMPPEAPSEGTMTETNVECVVSPNEDKSEGKVAEEEVEKSEANMTSEESTDVPTAESGKMSQRSSSVPDQQESIAVDKEKSSEGDRCSICGKRNCPSDPKLRSKITTTSEKSTDVTTAEAEKSTDVTTAAEKMSQSSFVPDQQESIAVDKEKSSEGDRCSICGKRNCPSDPKLRSKITTTSEKSTDVTTAEAEKMSQSSSVPDQQQVSVAIAEERSEGDRCSICGKRNCPADPKLRSKINQMPMTQKSLVGKPKSPRKSKFSQVNVMKVKKTKTPFKHCIYTRSLTNRLAKRIANHTPLHVFKLKGQLFKAVEDGDVVKVQELIQDTGAAVRKNKTRCTLLHTAASHNQADVVMFLLKLISPNITNKEGQTPAHVAAEKGHTQVLKLLMSDSDFDADKRDNCHNTVKTLLGGHLFKAVLEGNKKEAERLLAVGANPDSHGGKLVNGVLARELGVTTARLLASALNMEWAVTMFAKNARNDKAGETGLLTSAVSNSAQLKVPSRQFRVRYATAIQGATVYKTDKEARGFVRIFNFSCFKDRSDLNLQQLDYDARIMSDVFNKMGYMCKTHSSLTAQQTKEVMKNIRDGDELTDVGCAIFVICGYSVNGRSVLTSDMKCVDIDYMLNAFKDSECPQLKNKPKLFIFNLFNMNEVIEASSSESPKVMRLTDPLNDMACLYSNSIGVNCVLNGKGTSFSWSLCRTLAEHAAEHELCHFYRDFLKEYNKSSPSFSPELRYFGFTKKFFFNPM